MQPHQERVVNEKKELDDKIKKLEDFISSNETFKSLSKVNQILLKHQNTIMLMYSNILHERIELFND